VDDGEAEPLAYGLVANVNAETAHGDGGLDIQSGLKHFAAGAKLWLLPPRPRDFYERVTVVGHHRGSHGRRYVRMTMRPWHLTNFRVRAVYSPTLLRVLIGPDGDDLWATRDQAAAAIGRFTARVLEARLDGDSETRDENGYIMTRRVPDPPPLELVADGTTYYLAHFNAHRALYSSDPPPTERS
jgi:hypothetical protein